MRTPVRIAILTPIRVEYDAVRAQLHEWQNKLDGGRMYAQGYFEGEHHSYEIRLRETGAGNTTVALATQQVIDLFQPDIVLLVGIVGGVKDAGIGDVVIGTKAYGYESGKETDGGLLARPNVLPFSHALVEAARAVSRSDQWRTRIPGGGANANIYFGPIASGDKVIASTKSPLYGYLKERYNDTLALEMESIGFAQAVQPYRSVHALNIRAVSDLLDHKSEGDEVARQRMAAERAAAFVFELLYQLDCSSFMLPDMDPKTIAKEIYTLLFPMPASFKEIGNDFSHAANNEVREIWKKVKPLFIEEVEELAKDPEDAAAKGAVEMKLRKTIEKDPALANELAALMEQAKASGGGTSVSIVNSKNVVSGSSITVGGDFRVGDNVNNIGDRIGRDRVEINNYYGSDSVDASSKKQSHIPIELPKNIQDHIIDLISKGRSEHALNQLIDSTKDYPLTQRQTILSLSDRWQELAGKIKMGTISHDNAVIHRNQLVSTLIDLVS